MKPVLTFKVRPKRRGRLYYTVNVWENFKLFDEYTWWVKTPRNTYGLCSTWLRYSMIGQKSTECGEINFIRNRLYWDVVAHEATHAALGWGRRVGLDLDKNTNLATLTPKDPEELVCTAVSNIFGQIVREFHKAEIWSKKS